jgi:hypothetical protein
MYKYITDGIIFNLSNRCQSCNSISHTRISSLETRKSTCVLRGRHKTVNAVIRYLFILSLEGLSLFSKCHMFLRHRRTSNIIYSLRKVGPPCVALYESRTWWKLWADLLHRITPKSENECRKYRHIVHLRLSVKYFYQCAVLARNKITEQILRKCLVPKFIQFVRKIYIGTTDMILFTSKAKHGFAAPIFTHNGPMASTGEIHTEYHSKRPSCGN